MSKLIINRSEALKGQSLNVSVFLNEGKIGTISNSQEDENFELPKGSHLLHIEKDGIRSNQVRLKINDQQEVKVEMMKHLNLQRILIIILGWGMASFSFHQATGLGWILFLILGLIVGYLVKKNGNKLILKKEF